MEKDITVDVSDNEMNVLRTLKSLDPGTNSERPGGEFFNNLSRVNQRLTQIFIFDREKKRDAIGQKIDDIP